MDSTIRRMTRSDLDQALDWAAAEGWNPGLHDAVPFFAADPEGFFMATLDGVPVGSISAVAYDEQFGFIGLFLVRPEYRGHQIGLDLARVGREYLGGRNVGVDGVVAKQRQYAKAGFRLAYRNVRYEGVSNAADQADRDTPATLIDLSTVELDDLAAYDAELFPAARTQFLKPWIDQPGTQAMGVLRQGRLAGYGVMRACRSGFKIGPLFADEESLAELLLQRLIAHHPGELFYLDVPEPNSMAVGLAQRHGMTPVFETARMYTGEDPHGDLSRIFGVTTFELG